MQNKILKNSGWGILTALSLAPIVIWSFGPGVKNRFDSLASVIGTAGDLAGLCGFAMFALVLILSSRLKFLEKFFNGLNDAYSAHHFWGGLAFCLILFHPLFHFLNLASFSAASAVLFLLPSDSFALNAGRMAMAVMLITLIITFYFKIRYQIWKFSHKFLGLAFILAFLHVFFIGADVSLNHGLKYYFLVLGLVATSSYFYKSIFGRLLIKKFDYKIKNITLMPDKIWEIELEPQNEKINFEAGQFAFFKFFSPFLPPEQHPFSFSSNPESPKLAIKELGDYTSKIGKLKPGDTAEVEGPFGVFGFKRSANNLKNQIWIAGGIGITPFLSMLRSFSKQDSEYKIDLYYSVKDRQSLAFGEEIVKIARNFPDNINVVTHISQESGFLNAKFILDMSKSLKEKEIFICGPSAMMQSLKKQFADQGVSKKQIHTEEFQLY